jgi:hypothetical protein
MIFDVDKKIGSRVIVLYSGKRFYGTIKSVNKDNNTLTLSDGWIKIPPDEPGGILKDGGNFQDKDVELNASMIEKVEPYIT